MSDDATNEPNPPPLPRYSGDSKVPATFHPRTDCECDGYPGAMCGCWRNRTTTTKETA